MQKQLLIGFVVVAFLCSDSTAQEQGLSAEVEALCEDVDQNVAPVLKAVAGEQHVEFIVAETGAEDFSYFAEKVPGFYFNLGGRPADVAKGDAADHHTPDFHIDDSNLGLGVRAFTAMTLHYLNNHQ